MEDIPGDTRMAVVVVDTRTTEVEEDDTRTMEVEANAIRMEAEADIQTTVEEETNNIIPTLVEGNEFQMVVDTRTTVLAAGGKDIRTTVGGDDFRMEGAQENKYRMEAEENDTQTKVEVEGIRMTVEAKVAEEAGALGTKAQVAASPLVIVDLAAVKGGLR